MIYQNTRKQVVLYCLSYLLTLKPLSLVTTAAEVTDVKPAIVVAEPPKAIEVDPTVTVEFAN